MIHVNQDVLTALNAGVFTGMLIIWLKVRPALNLPVRESRMRRRHPRREEQPTTVTMGPVDVAPGVGVVPYADDGWQPDLTYEFADLRGMDDTQEIRDLHDLQEARGWLPVPSEQRRDWVADTMREIEMNVYGNQLNGEVVPA